MGEGKMKYIKKNIKSESGISLVESVMFLALIAVVIFILGPSIRQMFVGTPTQPGLATGTIDRQTSAFDEKNKGNITVSPGCVITGTSVTAEECAALDN